MIEAADGSNIAAAAVGGAAAMMKTMMGKSNKKDRIVLRSPHGSTDRDEWINALRTCSRVEHAAEAP